MKNLFFIFVCLFCTSAYGVEVISNTVPDCSGIYLEDINYPDGNYGKPVYKSLTEPYYWIFFDNPTYSWYIADEVSQNAGIAWFNDGGNILDHPYMPHSPYVTGNAQVVVPEPSMILMLMWAIGFCWGGWFAKKVYNRKN